MSRCVLCRHRAHLVGFVVTALASALLHAGPARTAPASGVPLHVDVKNLTNRRLERVPVTFGQVFKRGDVTRGLTIKVDGRPLVSQLDAKRRYHDGSVRFGVVTVLLDKIGPGERVRLALADGGPAASSAAAVTLADLLKGGFDAVVTLTFPDGTVRSATAGNMLERSDRQPGTWLRGPLVTEWVLSGPPLDAGFKPDEDLTVQFHVRSCAGGRRVRVSVVVENCWDTWAENICYDVAVAVGGKEVFTRRAVDHRRLSRWRKTFWWGEGEPPVHVAHDLAYLSATGALPNYDRTLPAVQPRGGRRDPLAMQGPDWEIMGRGPLTAYMPTTGGRPEIAPYPLWTVRYLLSMDPRAKAFVLGAGDLAGSWPIHVRARKTGRIMTIDRRPEFWLDQRGKDRPQWKPARHGPGPTQVRLSPDIAHQPSLAYVPYLVTGDFYYLEESYFWGNFCLLATWPHPRQNERGILSGQIRGNAWGLRNVADAGWIASDGDPEAAYFDRKVRNNIARRTKRMIGPPEYNKIGAWGLRTIQNARIQNPANPRWMVTAPWEEDYLIWSLHHLVELGYADAARPRDFLLRLRVGALTHAPDFDPRLATPYRMVVGEQGGGGKPVVYQDWKTLSRENARLSKPEVPNYGCSYAYSARAAVICGLDGGFPKAREALRTLEELLPGHRQVMAREPFWAIAPGGAAAGR